MIGFGICRSLGQFPLTDAILLMPARALRILIRDEAQVMIVNVGREDELGIESNSQYAVSFFYR